MMFCCSRSGFILVRDNTWCAFPLTSAPSRTHVGDFSLHALQSVSCYHWAAVSIRLPWQHWPILPCLHVFLLVTIGASSCDTGLVWSACSFSSVRLAPCVLPHGISLLISASLHLHIHHRTSVTCKPVFYVDNDLSLDFYSKFRVSFCFYGAGGGRQGLTPVRQVFCWTRPSALQGLCLFILGHLSYSHSVWILVRAKFKVTTLVLDSCLPYCLFVKNKTKQPSYILFCAVWTFVSLFPLLANSLKSILCQAGGWSQVIVYV